MSAVSDVVDVCDVTVTLRVLQDRLSAIADMCEARHLRDPQSHLTYEQAAAALRLLTQEVTR